MTRYRYFTATTLDGYLATEDDSLDWLFEQEDDHGDGESTDGDDGSHGDYEEFIAGIGAIVMGAATYAWVCDHLARSGEAWPYTQPSFVFTHRTFEAVGAGITFVQGTPEENRAAIEDAAGDRDVWVVGGGGLAADFGDAGMLHELLLSIAPVTLGAGKPLLARPFDLRLTRLDRNGPFVVARYDVRGPRR